MAGGPGQGMDVPSPIPHTMPYTALPSRSSSVCSIIFFNKLVNMGVSLRSGTALAT